MLLPYPNLPHLTLLNPRPLTCCALDCRGAEAAGAGLLLLLLLPAVEGMTDCLMLSIMLLAAVLARRDASMAAIMGSSKPRSGRCR